jgi:hypothetical protein
MSRPGLIQERLIALFLFGALLFTPPLLGVFNSSARVFGIPTLYLYLFAAWTLLIVLVALVIESSDAADDAVGTVEAQSGGTDVTAEKMES